jgi:hypothetical protein
MKTRVLITAAVLALLATPVAVQAQGMVRGAQEGAAAGNRAAGPVGAAVGGVGGAVVGGVAGGVKGVIGVPQRTSVRRTSKHRRTARRSRP